MRSGPANEYISQVRLDLHLEFAKTDATLRRLHYHDFAVATDVTLQRNEMMMACLPSGLEVESFMQ